jgi:hypothetical protein
VKVSVLWVGVQFQALAKLLYLRTGRGGVRWLNTDGMAENRGERGSDGIPEADKGAGTDEVEGDGLLL